MTSSTLHVVERPETDTALEALADLGRVVLEPAQRLDGEVVGHHDAVADQTGLGVAADLAAAHREPAMLPNLEERKISRISECAELDLLVLRLEHALERGLDLFDRLVDDRVVADLDALALASPRPAVSGRTLKPMMTALSTVARLTSFWVIAPTPRWMTAADLVAHLDLQQRVLERLDRTGDVALDDEVERVDLGPSARAS
jgi:hypothetical protein